MAGRVRVQVLFFGLLKDIAGVGGETLELAEGATLGTLFDLYAAKFPELERRRGSIMLARNHEFGTPATPLAEGDEVALLPPVSGGSEPGADYFALTREPIDTRAIVRRLQSGENGNRAVSTVG
jgi:molybdopterin synthase catalytic subunit